MTAEEYEMLCNCLDAGIATSVENYWRRDQAQAAERHTEHYGFLAHELRNALGNANMAFKLMRAGKLGVEGRTGDVLSRNLTRMAALVAQWLGSVQAVVQRPSDSGPIHVASMLRDVEGSLLPDRGISIVLETDELLFISGDDMLFHSAVSNLVHNAVKFSKPQGVVGLRARSEPGDTVLVEVSDECGGLEGRSLADLCSPFDNRRAGHGSSRGLGLAITKLAVDTLAGELSLLEKPGQGCVFSLRFPLLRPS
jgi:signal transduction histidine kinase